MSIRVEKRIFLNSMGGGLIGALVASSIIGISALSFQRHLVASTQNLYRLRLKSSEQLITANLKIAALSVSALKQTKSHELLVRRCTTPSGTCQDSRKVKVGWYDGLDKKISDSESDSGRGILYNDQGEICTDSPVSFGKKCPFKVASEMYFYCSSGASCSEAESAKIKFFILKHSSVSKYLKDRDFEVTIPRVTPEVITTEKTVVKQGTTRTITRTVNTFRPRADGDGDGDGGGR